VIEIDFVITSADPFSFKNGNQKIRSAIQSIKTRQT